MNALPELHAPLSQGNDPDWVDIFYSIVKGDLGSGNIGQAAVGLSRYRHQLAERPGELQSLEQEVTEALLREAEAGGSGSLFDPDHPFVLAVQQAIENARRPFNADDWP